MTGAAALETPIDVIMRTGGRDPALLDRAVASVAAQTAGRIRLLLVMHGPTDAHRIVRFRNERLAEIAPIQAPGADRSRAMAAGLARVTAPRFGLLDDDDYWLDDHLARLLAASEAAGPEPVFAYSDILRLQEHADPPALDIWREGPAEPPLGRITDRISVHCFLADRRALAPLHPKRWDLETAEDALLVASLLARSTPVHAPGATAVYCMGRGDASAYLRHPNRARDELTFARGVAPLLPDILARFGAEVPDEAAFLRPFIAAEAAARLAKRLAGARAPIATLDGEETPHLADDPALVCEPLLGAFVAGDGAAVDHEGGATLVRFAAPYAYAASLDLTGAAAPPPCRLAIVFGPHEATASAVLLDAEGSLIAEAVAPPSPVGHELQMGLPTDAVRLILRCPPGSEGSTLRVERLGLAYPIAALAPDREGAEAALKARGGKRRIGGPHPEGEGRPLIDAPAAAVLETPWAYAWSCALPTGLHVIALSAKTAGAGCRLVFVDEGWAQVGEGVALAEGAPGAEVVAIVPAGASRLVLQAGAEPGGRRVVVEAATAHP